MLWKTALKGIIIGILLIAGLLWIGKRLLG
jgi:hypothetical protein